MIDKNDENLQIFIDESLEHIADIESELLAIEERGANIDDAIVNKVYRAAHSIKGGAGFLGLINIMAITHEMETILGKFRNREIVPEPATIDPLLMAADMLRNLINNVEAGNSYDISEPMNALLSVKDGPPKDTEPESRDAAVPPDIAEIQFPDGTGGFQLPFEKLRSYRNADKRIYLILFDPADPQITPDELKNAVDSLEQCGYMEASSPDRDRFPLHPDQQTAAEPRITILYATILTPEDLNILLKPTPCKIYEYLEGEGLVPISELFETAPVENPDEDRTVFPKTTAAPEDIPETPAPAETNPQALHDRVPEISAEPSVDSKETVKERKSDSGKSLRVNIGLLDSLMQLAGELVLSRNQLIRAISRSERRLLEVCGQRIDHITSDLQDAVMRTRMQPIWNVFGKFPRVVRDIAQDLNKKIELTIEGKEVELDKSIIENLNDPLTHIIRNAADHGIESPETRRMAGKDPTGRIMLHAYHEAGQVNIEISDNGKGMDGGRIAEIAVQKRLITEEQAQGMSLREKLELIFLPGFSTSRSITELSGRGVGMDVVKTNLERIGGVVDVDSVQGQGTAIRIKLPLTLAIIPSLLVADGDERYAVPQANVMELVRIPYSKIKNKLEYAGGAEVIRLRGRLLPLMRLSHFLGSNDGRKNTPQTPYFGNGENAKDTEAMLPVPIDAAGAKPLNIAVVTTGVFKYGLVVDQLLDTEEIVVKPLGRHLKECKGYTGATILGDGRVALILDISELAGLSGLSSVQDEHLEIEQWKNGVRKAEGAQTWLLFSNGGKEQFAVDLQIVERIQKIHCRDIEYTGGRRCMAFRNTTLILFDIADVADVDAFKEESDALALIFYIAGMDVGILAAPPVDSVETDSRIDSGGFKQPGVAGSIIINGKTVLVVDVFDLAETIHPEWFSEQKAAVGLQKNILLAEDTKLFRNQMKCAMENEGYRVIETGDGAEAWECLTSRHDEIALVVTDLEMPNMDGFELARRIRDDARFGSLPVIAVSSLEGGEDIQRGKECGVTEHQVKLNREKLIQSVRRYMPC